MPTAAVAEPQNDAHYRAIVEAAHNLVIFLGAGVNAESGLPDDADLARELAAKAGLEGAPTDLARVAQYARTSRGEAAVSEWLGELLTLNAKPGEIHKRLAGLPKQFAKVGLEPRYQMIVTPQYDAALEQALKEAGERYDVAVYMEESGSFVHCPWEELPRPIATPNEYPPKGQEELGFPIVRVNNRLLRTVIVRISGALEDPSVGFDWEDNYVITEDQYIDYLSGLPAAQAIPAQILAKLKKASYLFLGYTISDWRLRVFLHRVWRGSKLGGQKYWAVEPEPDQLELDLWTDAGVRLHQTSIGSYLEGLYSYLEAHAAELGK